jgi:hypothetical protein
MVAHGDDVGDLLGAPCPGRAEGDQLGAWPASEVVDVHAHEGSTVGSPHGGTHGVDPVFVRSGIGGLVDGATCQVNEFRLIRGHRTSRGRQ